VTVIALTGNDGSVVATADPREVLMVAGTGVVTVVPLMLFAWSAQRVPFTLLGPMQYVIPSINFLLGWAVYHEEMTSSRLAGFALVWAGLVLITVDTVHDRRSAGPIALPSPLSWQRSDSRWRRPVSSDSSAMMPPTRKAGAMATCSVRSMS
jgi:chloramphenicol-sensitive protein RarD